MSETRKQRRARLMAAMDWSRVKGDSRTPALFDALLDALEPPVAEMVRRGIPDQEMRSRIVMTEPPAERRERLAGVIGRAGVHGDPETILDALLDALEPPLAEMVSRGVEWVRLEGSAGTTQWCRTPPEEPGGEEQ